MIDSMTNGANDVDTTPRLMPRDTALKALIDVTNVLDEYGCTHWLSDGTLLGAIRENDFIAHDYDIDVGVLASSFDPKAVHALIDEYGFTLSQTWGVPEDGFSLSVERDNIRLDIFFYYPRDAGLYYSYYARLTMTKAKRYDCIYPEVTCIKRVFLGHKFWVPKDAEKHLETQYGPDWRVPVPTWNWITDPYNKKFTGIVVRPADDSVKALDYLGIPSDQ